MLNCWGWANGGVAFLLSELSGNATRLCVVVKVLNYSVILLAYHSGCRGARFG